MNFIPQIPLLKDTISESELQVLRKRIKTDTVKKCSAAAGYIFILKWTSIEPELYVRAIQEIEILKTKVMGYDKRVRRYVMLSSFHELWFQNKRLRKQILRSSDPHEEKWIAGTSFKYKLATNFKPMYVKCIYEHFNATTVLDPCAGWGDRMAGALSTQSIHKYVAFDPNTNLCAGYKKIMRDFGNIPTFEDQKTIVFNESHTIHSVCYEEGEHFLKDLVFDFAFTSPPFFLYEDYGTHMPRYKNWLVDFYTPLFVITHQHLKPHGFFAIRINDTPAGSITDFMLNEVPKITSFRFKGKIGYYRMGSARLADIYLFQRGAYIRAS